MSIGVGLTFSPVVGSLLFEIGGFSFPFYFLGGILVFASIFVFKIVPAHADSQS